MNKPLFNDLGAQWQEIRARALPQIIETLESGNYVSGEKVERFEKEFAEYTGSKFCVALNSGTSALYAALLALGVGPGDKVVVQNNTFIATATSVLLVGATPVLVDVDVKSGQICPDQLANVLHDQPIAAVIVVHLWGHAAKIEEIANLCQRYQVPIIEDCAQAHGTKVNERHVGTFGEIGCFSFYPGKSLGAAGEGGAIVTNKQNLAESVKKLRNWGQSEKYVHESFGINLRMDEVQAVVLTEKLSLLQQWTRAKQEVIDAYHSQLPSEYFFEQPELSEIRGYHLAIVQIPNRKLAMEALTSAGIPFGIHYPITISEQRSMHGKFDSINDLQNSLQIAKSLLSLPLHPWVTEDQVKYICSTLIEAQKN